jgi:hypothetical protein
MELCRALIPSGKDKAGLFSASFPDIKDIRHQGHQRASHQSTAPSR